LLRRVRGRGAGGGDGFLGAAVGVEGGTESFHERNAVSQACLGGRGLLAGGGVGGHDSVSCVCAVLDGI